MAKACEECTQSCLMMHKKNKDPRSLVTTFFKVMIGDDYSKILYLPPNFARRIKNLVEKNKTTHLEDFSGEKWNVKFTKIDDRLVFEEGWNTFASAHKLQKGDLLVFHYIRNSHFVVLMYGPTGCPELRHYGFSHHPMKETKKSSNNKLPVNGQSPSEVLTSCNNFSHESSSSKSQPLVHGVNGIKTSDKKRTEVEMSPNENATNTQHLVASSSKPLDKEIDERLEQLKHNNFSNESSSKSQSLVHGVNGMKTSDKKLSDDEMSPNENTTNTQHLVASSSRPLDKEIDQRLEQLVKITDKETDKRSETLVKCKDRETDQRSESLVKETDKETDQRSEPMITDTDKATDKETDQRSEMMVKNAFPDYIFDSPPTVKPFCVMDSSNGHEQDKSRRKSLQPVVVKSDVGLKNNMTAGGGGSDETENMKARKLGEAKIKARMEMTEENRKKNNVTKSEVTHNNFMHKRPLPADFPITPSKVVKKELGTSASRLDNSGHPFSSTETSFKPMARCTESIKKEPTMNHGFGYSMRIESTMNNGRRGLKIEEPTIYHGSGVSIKMEPKSEPIDYDEAPLSGSYNTSFAAVMDTYQYLELPSSVRLKSKVILLRNGNDLWAVLYQTKYHSKVLTQNWGTFAKEKGIKPGDKCNFVLESEPSSRFACTVFDVHVTR